VEPEEAKWIRFDVIRSVDRPLLNSEMISKVDLTLVTELDWQLFQLQRKYLDYQVNIGNRIIAVLQSGEPDAAQKAQALSEPKRMFTWASVMILPFSASHVASIPWAEVPVSAWWETGYVIFFGTYLGYILMMIGQKTLRPTVVSVYNYVQPLVSVSVSVLVGLAVFKGTQALAALLVFSGVWLVIKSKSKHDIDKHDHSLAYEKRHA
jgi:hypothetical protein